MTRADSQAHISQETGITGSDIRSTDDLSVDNLEVKGALGVAPGDCEQ